MKSSTRRLRPNSAPARRGTVLVLVGSAAAFAILFVLGAAVGIVDVDFAIYTGCALSTTGGVIAFLNDC